jgi:hypothetical protein
MRRRSSCWSAKVMGSPELTAAPSGAIEKRRPRRRRGADRTERKRRVAASPRRLRRHRSRSSTDARHHHGCCNPPRGRSPFRPKPRCPRGPVRRVTMPRRRHGAHCEPAKGGGAASATSQALPDLPARHGLGATRASSVAEGRPQRLAPLIVPAAWLARGLADRRGGHKRSRASSRPSLWQRGGLLPSVGASAAPVAGPLPAVAPADVRSHGCDANPLLLAPGCSGRTAPQIQRGRGASGSACEPGRRRSRLPGTDRGAARGPLC